MKNIFTVDLEDWFCAYNLRIKVEDWDKQERRIVKNTRRILKLLSNFNTKATFFVLGWVAEKEPKLIREIESEGHEIATHGYSHSLITNISPEEFEIDLQKAIDVTSSISKMTIIGFRAPSFTITNKTRWALNVLKKHGIKYDSSVFPVGFHPDYGIADSDINIHKLNGITEVPLSVLKILGITIPCSGGAYFRIYPYIFTKKLIEKCNSQGRPVIFYMHPWEIDPEQPRQALSISKSIRHYYNLNQTENRLKKLLSDFQFHNMKDELNL